jgi:Zn ribbon nucleic-acid-binding protein
MVTITAVLKDIGLIDGPLGVDDFYSAGPAFLDYLSFLGCAPTVVFDPPTADSIGSGDFYHFHCPAVSGQPVFRSDGFSYTPKCPACKESVSNWREWWSEGRLENRACSSCGTQLSPDQLNWRRRAGCARIFVDILGIHAETVKPVPGLFEALEKATGVAWQYFFVEDGGV